ncbi:cell division suppressor protein YneA [Anaerospora hongkongensis]|uniref:cell division suppressor protein YneA n=1 Tax=Anaerospora hongkongensis TaxID=244830 RepID=UPI0028A1D2D9|nr:LysM domain-containing protein [Anaerospora hongkongensis]
MLNKFTFIFFLVLLATSVVDVFTDFNEEAVVHYKTVVVEKGDTIWNIAAKHTTQQDDIRNVIAMIKQANHLDQSVQIYPGQTLRIPVADSSGWASIRQKE